MYTALVILILLVCFLLALVVLAQNPKGGGISSQFGSGGAANLMGVKRTGDLLEKLTWGFAIALVVLSLGTHMLRDNAGPARSVNQERAMKERSAAPLPATPAPGATAPAVNPDADGKTPPAGQPATPAPAEPADVDAGSGADRNN